VSNAQHHRDILAVPKPLYALLRKTDFSLASVRMFLSGFHQLLHFAAAVQPSQVPDVGIRYGIQIGQAFGYDFGIGIIRDVCFVSFVIV
jgi:hypothetical protein